MNREQVKALYQTAQAQKKIHGLNRSFAMYAPMNSVLFPLWDLGIAQSLKPDTCSESEVLSLIFGEENAKLLAEKCLNPYWFWYLVAELVDYSDDWSVQLCINKLCSHYQHTHRELFWKNELSLDEMAQAIAYGLWLFDEEKKIAIRNPLFVK